MPIIHQTPYFFPPMSPFRRFHHPSSSTTPAYPQVWKLLIGMVECIFLICKSGINFNRSSRSSSSYEFEEMSNESMIKGFITMFFDMTKEHDDTKQARGHLRIFLTSPVPLSLVELYNSEVSENRAIAEKAIKHFINSIEFSFSEETQKHCAPVVLEFCKLLSSSVGTSDRLYIYCRTSLRSMVESLFIDGDYSYGIRGAKIVIDVRDFFPFIGELAEKLSHDLVLSMGSKPFAGVSSGDVRDFAVFVYAISMELVWKLGERGLAVGGTPLPKENAKECYEEIDYEEQMELMHGVFKDLMGKMEVCLEKMEGHLEREEEANLRQMESRWKQYFAILKQLHRISKMFEGAEELFWGILRQRKVCLSYLIFRFARISNDHEWVRVRKDVIDFKTRRHLIMMMFPDVEYGYDGQHEMLIDRSKVLEESFEYIRNADIESLHFGIIMEFKNEKAAGPGVLREWFILVCQAIFDPRNSLFVSSPNDHRRFFPNPASSVDPLCNEYFHFAGRVIALALMHKIQIGIVFDRVFFVQLAGKKVSLEDIRDADPYLYNSCKAILEMEADMVDQDVLGLTFAIEVFELGIMKVVELCYRGENVSVTSRNREEYVYLLVQHIFVTSIAKQVYHFTEGFADMMNSDDSDARDWLQRSFFDSMDLKEFDWMLHGSESSLCVEDWMAHTEYDGFKETDPQICWFWKIVGEMSIEQRTCLLFFWTSIKYLPVEGFPGLASPLHINRSFESTDRLPSSHTCFYHLYFPAYPSEEVMQDRLHIITKGYVACSFGT